MGRSTNDLHVRLNVLINASVTAAANADEDRIRLVLGFAANDGQLDKQTVVFLRQGRRYVLGTAVALSAVRDAHRGQAIHPARPCAANAERSTGPAAP